MRRRPLQVSVLVVLVGLAGCGSLVGESTPTLTPVGSSTDGIPGLTSTGVDATALAESHEAVLSETNYTVSVRERISQNGTVRRNATRYREVAAGARRYALTRVQRTSGFPSSALAPSIAYWYDGTSVVTRIGNGSGARYDRYPTSPPGPLFDPTSHEGIAGIFGAFTLRQVETANGTIRLESTGFPRPQSAPTPSFVGTARNASLQALVSPRGYVESYRYEYEANATAVDGSVRVTRRVQFRDVGATAVSRPAWTARASREE